MVVLEVVFEVEGGGSPNSGSSSNKAEAFLDDAIGCFAFTGDLDCSDISDLFNSDRIGLVFDSLS